MHPEPAKVIAAFFAIDTRRIEKEIREAPKRLADILSRSKELRSDFERSAEIEAEVAHLSMLQACALTQIPHIASEYRVFYASFGTNSIVNAVVDSSLSKDRLKEISQQMEEIRKREGLDSEDLVFVGSGPADYQALEVESGKLLDRVSDTIFAEILRRYGLRQELELFERDPKEFDIQNEIGRRALEGDTSGNAVVDVLFDRKILKDHGKAGLARIRKRSAELRQARNRG